MKILLLGANGKMGKIVQEYCVNHNIDTICVDPTFAKIQKQQLDTDCKNVDVVLDFSNADALSDNLDFCLKNNLPYVVATTNHSKQNLKKINKAKDYIAIFFSPNFSFGFNLFLQAIKNLNRKIFDVAIIEQHHKSKKDNPSGSAKQIAKVMEDREDLQIFGIRGGTEIGTHTVLFFSKNEKIEITHTAQNRIVFAHGAICACQFLQDKSKGLYSMKDLVDQ